MPRFLARLLGHTEPTPAQIVFQARSDAAKRGIEKRRARTAKQRAAERELMIDKTRAMRLARGLPWRI